MGIDSGFPSFIFETVFPRLLFVILAFASLRSSGAETLKTRNVLFISTDGLRWQELFRGAEEALMTKENGGVPAAEVNALRRKYWRATPEERRAVLMPFMWGEVAKRGQIFGNRDRGSEGSVLNGFNFSYPGYSEFLCGVADDERLTTNDAIPNPNINVLEFLAGRPDLRGRVAACNAWTVLPAILNRERNGLPMWTPGDATPPAEAGPVQQAVERAVASHPWPWRNCTYDIFTHQVAIEWIRLRKPRVLYLNYGENDEWAHAGRYDRHLESIARVDGFVRELWEMLQSMPEYRGTTTLVFTTDHGRGSGLRNWTSHGKSIPESREWWCAAMGPDTPALGERANVTPVAQAQIAATIARFMGEDFCGAIPAAAQPISGFFPRSE
jgi:hypothetical protein